MRDHTRLNAFTFSDELVIEVYKITKNFPIEELFGLTAQIRRSAVSIPSNIVEGCARESQKEYSKFLQIAYSSLKELHYQCDLSQRLGYINEAEFNSLNKRLVLTGKVVAALVRKMRLP